MLSAPALRLLMREPLERGWVVTRFHSTSHGRESVSFADSTGDSGETIQIETQGVESLHAGIYGDPEPEDEALFITNEYDPAGTIKLITVTCFGPGRQSCQP